jgi:putative phage-type endonuclease
MLTKEQLDQRRAGVGASEAAAVMGMSPWAGPLDVYLSKVAEDPVDISTEAMEAGNYLEDGIARWYADLEGAKIERVNRSLRHPRHDYVLATPDRFIVDERRRRLGVLEVKDVGRDSDEWGATGTDEVPRQYLIQVQQQLAVTDLPYAKLVAFFHDRRQRPRVYHIDEKPELQQVIIDAVRTFWFEHVIPRVPPPVDGHEGSREWLKRTYFEHDDKIIDAPADAEKWLRMYVEAREAMAKAEALRDESGNYIKAFIGGHLGIRGAGLTATWKMTRSGGTDWQAVANELARQLATVEEPGGPSVDNAVRKRYLDEAIEKCQAPGVRRLLVKERK